MSATGRMKDTASRIMDSQVKAEDDMRGFFAEEMAKVDAAETLRQRRREHDGSDVARPQVDDADDMERIVAWSLAARSRSRGNTPTAGCG